MATRDTWRLRGLTLRAMVLLCVARLLVGLAPLRFWRASLGQISAPPEPPASMVALPDANAAKTIAAHVERGAARLPFASKCLPRAMVLCWLLRLRHIPYELKIAVRPAAARTDPDDGNNLHAWVVSAGVTVIGDLPGPWLISLTLHGGR